MSEITPHDPPLNFEGNWLYGFLAAIFQYLKTIAISQAELETQVRANTLALASVQVTLETLATEDETDFAAIREALDKVLIFLTPPSNPAASITLIIKGDNMAKATTKLGKFKLDLQDDGTLKYTVAVNDDAGLATAWDGAAPLAAVSSDPAVVVTPAGDGTSGTIGPSTPPVLASGIIITVSGTTARGQAVSSDNSADPINVKPGAAGSVVLSVSA